MKRLALFAALALAGCAPVTGADSPAPSPATALYAMSATLSQAEVTALAYVKSPLADPAAVAEIKRLDIVAYNAVHPPLDAAASGGSPVTAIEVTAAQAALDALTTYLTSKGAN